MQWILLDSLRYYLDWAQLADLLRVLSESCLVFAEDVITTEAGTSREDETRDAIVAEASRVLLFC